MWIYPTWLRSWPCTGRVATSAQADRGILLAHRGEGCPAQREELSVPQTRPARLTLTVTQFMVWCVGSIVFGTA